MSIYLKVSYRGMIQSEILCIIIYIKARFFTLLEYSKASGTSCHIQITAPMFERIIVPSSAVSSSPKGTPYISFSKP
jgi:hypothetical protein